VQVPLYDALEFLRFPFGKGDFPFAIQADRQWPVPPGVMAEHPACSQGVFLADPLWWCFHGL
jgi:hypothetical protein